MITIHITKLKIQNLGWLSIDSEAFAESRVVRIQLLHHEGGELLYLGHHVRVEGGVPG